MYQYEKQIIFGCDELDSVVDFFVNLMDSCDVFTFTGPLGAGKSTIIRLMLRKCGIQDTIASPTFTYVNQYENERGQTFYHFDLYRVATLNEFMHAGFDEYLYAQNSWSFVEWPELIMPLVKKRVCHVVLDYYAQDKRQMRCLIIEGK